MPATWSGGMQLMSSAADAHLLEAPRGAPEGVALGAAPVLAVDAAQRRGGSAGRTATPAGRSPAAPSIAASSDGREQRQRLEQDEVGRLGLVGEQAREEPDRLAPPRRSRRRR